MPTDFEPAISFDHSFQEALPGMCVRCAPAPVASADEVFFNESLSEELGWPCALWSAQARADLGAGRALPAGAAPVAQAYAGHQFGHFAPRLGDGRALLWGEVLDRHGHRRDLAFKGSGRTPFSRGGDGLAALGPMLREAIMGEAMHALGIPTTRALAVVATGGWVRRTRPLPSAVLTRVAASHLRVGTVQYAASQGDDTLLRQVVAYAISRHDPQLLGRPDATLAWLDAVAQRQAHLVAKWMNVGFIHGVMNTDNMALSGETLDYGPCAFMEAYDPATVFSSIDHHGRYAYGQQPQVAQWNLARLAEAVLPLLHEDEAVAVAQAQAVLQRYAETYEAALLAGQRAKLGLMVPAWQSIGGDASGAALARTDQALVAQWLSLLEKHELDWTLAWRGLAEAACAVGMGAECQTPAALNLAFLSFLQSHGAVQVPDGRTQEGLVSAMQTAFLPWWKALHARWLETGWLGGLDVHATLLSRGQAMRLVNPFVVPRNHLVEDALEAAESRADFAPFHALLAAVRRPYEAGWGGGGDEAAWYLRPAPRDYTAGYRTFCGT